MFRWLFAKFPGAVQQQYVIRGASRARRRVESTAQLFPKRNAAARAPRAPHCSRVLSARPDPDTHPERAPHRRLLHRRQLAPKLSQAGEAGERGGWRGTVFPKRAAAERAEQNLGLCNPRLEQQQALHCTVLQESTCVTSITPRPTKSTNSDSFVFLSNHGGSLFTLVFGSLMLKSLVIHRYIREVSSFT